MLCFMFIELSKKITCIPFLQFNGSHCTQYYFVKKSECKCKPFIIMLKTIEKHGPFSSILYFDLWRSFIFGGQ